MSSKRCLEVVLLGLLKIEAFQVINIMRCSDDKVCETNSNMVYDSIAEYDLNDPHIHIAISTYIGTDIQCAV